MIGGLEKVTQELARTWTQAGHTVRVITNRSSRSLSHHERMDGISISRYYFLWELPKFGFLSLLQFVAQCLFLPWTFWCLWRSFDPRKTDVVSVHYVGPPAWWAVLVAKKRSLPVTVTLHGSDLLIEPRRSWLKRFMLRRVLRLADEVSTVSRFMLRELEKFFPEAAGKGVVIANGLDPCEFEGVHATVWGRPYAVCVARLSPQKGQELLIDAFDRLGPRDPGFDLIFLGDGPTHSGLYQKVKSSPLSKRMTLLGGLPHDQVLSFIKGASFVVIPSQAEPFGLVALEARAFGRPVVAFEEGALPEVLAAYPAVVWVSHQAPEALAQGMKRAMEMKPLDPKPPNLAEDWATVAARYLDLFSKHINGRSP